MNDPVAKPKGSFLTKIFLVLLLLAVLFSLVGVLGGMDPLSVQTSNPGLLTR